MAEDQEVQGSEPARRALPALVLGLSIGWLMGLSVAETVASTVAALLALVGGIGAGLYTFSRNRDSSVIDLWPLALIGFGIALGASGGLYARTHAWLGAQNTEIGNGAGSKPYLYAVNRQRCDRLRSAMDASTEKVRRALGKEFPKTVTLFESEGIGEDTLIDFVEELCPIEE